MTTTITVSDEPADRTIADAAKGPEAYNGKDDQYFRGARHDYVACLPHNPDARILEIGCGNGDTGALALRTGKCQWYCGVEICERVAADARRQISEVVVADVEQWQPGSRDAAFDALILSEVLEHLADPWATLRKLRCLMKPGACVFASSPNVSHHSVVRMLLHGDWALADKGIMDRTHLRWFTPASYRRLFESASFVVDSVAPLSPPGPRGRIVNACTFRKFAHLFAQQITLRGHCE
jgi:2-polyprenyl-3-methyl-5-hydroxy-6-metoxy-1,4-benzoquinol methylase